jgi:hypothetical protein
MKPVGVIYKEGKMNSVSSHSTVMAAIRDIGVAKNAKHTLSARS